jgi:hypothetical protein
VALLLWAIPAARKLLAIGSYWKLPNQVSGCESHILPLKFKIGDDLQKLQEFIMKILIMYMNIWRGPSN